MLVLTLAARPKLEACDRRRLTGTGRRQPERRGKRDPRKVPGQHIALVCAPIAIDLLPLDVVDRHQGTARPQTNEVSGPERRSRGTLFCDT